MIYVHRTLAWLLRLAIALDQLGRVLVGGPFYIVGLGGLPSADQTISAWVGINAAKGKPWALAAQAAIDDLFYKGHCQHAVLSDGKD